MSEDLSWGSDAQHFHTGTIHIRSQDVPPYAQQIDLDVAVQVWDRSTHPLLENDARLAGDHLFEVVAERSYMGALPFEVWTFGRDSIQIFRLQGTVNPITLSVICGLPEIEQIAVLGQIHKRERGQIHPMAHVYVEDQQGRWWFGAQALDSQGIVVLDEPASSWVGEHGKPLGIGGWFAHSRRHRFQSVLRLDAEN